MSFSSIASYTSGNGTDIFPQGFEDLDANFFDIEQFVDLSPNSQAQRYSNDQESEISGLSTCESYNTLISFEEDPNHTNEHTSRQGELWAIEASAATQPHHFRGNALYSELSGRAAISDSELLSLEGITLNSPHIRAHSQPFLPSFTSPTASRRKPRLTESLTKTFKKATDSIEKSLRSPIRKQNSLLKMGRTSNQSQTSIDQWGHKLEADALKFKFDFEDNPVAFLDAPYSTGEAMKSDSLNNIKIKAEKVHGVTQYTPQTNQSDGFETPLTTPTLTGEHSRKTSSEASFPLTPQLQHPSAYWSQNIPPSQRITSALADETVWWNHAPTSPVAQPLPTGFHSNPQLATKSLALQLQNDLTYENNDNVCSSSIMSSGLMIQMPGYNSQQSFIPSSSPPTIQRGFGHSQPQSLPQQQYHARGHHSEASPRQPSQSSPVRKNRSSESSDSDTTSPKLSSTGFHVRKRKSSKTSKQMPPLSPTGLGGAVDFVNYTPNDSRKILTGVAPSGSSKTKARREKEALEKRRKLSQAALKAVKAAGGDVESLVEQGLIV